MYLVEQAREVTGGNPGRIEEAARHYRDKGTLPPPMLQESSIDYHLEELAPADLALLQNAALMGGVFWLGGLVVLDRADREPHDPPPLWHTEPDPARHEIEAALMRLAEKNFVMRLPDSTFAGDEEYVFKSRALRERLSALTRSPEARKRHRLLASWLESQPETKSHEEYLELLAEQREKSGADALAAQAYFEAAERARQHLAPKRELSCYEKALSLLGHEAQGRRLEAMLRRGELLELLHQTGAALACFRDALYLAFQLDRKSAGAAAQSGIDRLVQRFAEGAKLLE